MVDLDPKLTEAARATAIQARAVVNVAGHAVIESYDDTVNPPTVKCRILVSAIVDGGDGAVGYLDWPTMDDVPVQWPSGGGYSDTFPLVRGGLVLLVCRDRSHDEVDAGNHSPPIHPRSTRRWNPADYVAWPVDNLPANATSANGRVFRIPDGKKLLIGSALAAKALALAQKVEQELAKIQTAHNSHVHLLTIVGTTGTAAPPVVTYTPATVGSSRAFTDDT